MLFIFRKLRKSFFLPGKAKTYLAYALGEIFLIVVGILIAVQIGEWKQEQRDRVEERYLLTELMDNLKQEAARLEEGLEITARLLRNMEVIRGYYKDGSFTKEEFEKQLQNYPSYFAFSPTTSAFETMKATGLGFSNRQLKTVLMKYYGVDRPLLVNNLEGDGNFVRLEIGPLLMKHLDPLDYRQNPIPTNIDDLQFKMAVLRQIAVRNRRVSRHRDGIEDTLKSNRAITSMVIEELDK